VHFDLVTGGERVGRKRVARLMRASGLRAMRKRKYLGTTDSRHSMPAAPNIIDRNFSPAAPNQAWASDATFIHTGEGWLLLAVVIDLYSRRIVGWAMDRKLDRELTIGALNMAVQQRRPGPGLVVHSDRGRQYACAEYRAFLAQHGFVQSMSRLANVWDNAVAESFFATLKTELVFHKRYPTRAEARTAVFEWVEAFYNRQRRHSTLRYLTPVEYEMKHAAA
jgi:transposase InsO family protein